MSRAVSERERGSRPSVVREFEALLSHYRRRTINGATLLAWLNDRWTQDKLMRADDGPSRWLAAEARAALLGAADGRIGDDQAHAAIAALIPEYRRRRDAADWEP